MSEPLSSVEIEDVLSSIRRLVSEDLRPGVRIARPAETPQAGGGKLILTPALRVVTDDRPPAEAAPVSLPEAPVIEQVMAVVGAAVSARNDDWEPENGDVEIMVSDSLAASENWLDSETAAGAAWSDDSDVDVVEFETAFTTTAVDTDDARRTSSPAELAPAELDLIEADQRVDIPGWAQQSGENRPNIDDDPVPAEMQGLAGTLEPDVAWADEAEARVIAELESGLDAPVDPALSDGEQGAAFEEQILRELVRDIIRDELQGGLGERITRNIRKLVRAEIARALATQALD